MLSRRTVCQAFLFVFIPLAVVAVPLVYLIWIPYNRALNHEIAYFEELKRIEDVASSWDWDPELRAMLEKMIIPSKDQLRPLIHDIAQLTSWGYEEQLDLHEGGSAKSADRQVWTYVGGTAHKRSLYERISLYTAPNGSCVDEAHICNSFNDGFNQVLENDHILGCKPHEFGASGNIRHAFMDCDVSPLLCDYFGVDPVMLIHMETKEPCTIELEPEYKRSCSVKWTLVGLPLRRMPFSKQINIGGNIVPVFPNAYEQLSAMVTFDGSTNAIGLDKFDIRESIMENTED